MKAQMNLLVPAPIWFLQDFQSRPFFTKKLFWELPLPRLTLIGGRGIHWMPFSLSREQKVETHELQTYGSGSHAARKPHDDDAVRLRDDVPRHGNRRLRPGPGM